MRKKAMFDLRREMASRREDGRENDRKLNMSFHGRRAPRPDLIRCFAREMNSRFVEGDEEVGIVPYVVMVWIWLDWICRNLGFEVWIEEEDEERGFDFVKNGVEMGKYGLGFFCQFFILYLWSYWPVYYYNLWSLLLKGVVECWI